MTGYNDYLIVLSPSASIINQVKGFKDMCHKEIGGYESHYSTAHISIQYWPRKRAIWIEPLIPKLERDLQALSPITLNINGFGFFDHHDSRTIYAKLNSSPLTQIWFKHLRKFFNTSNFEPQITIAKAIPAEAFVKLWPDFKNRQWNEQFEVDKLTILKREHIGYDKSYKVFKQIPFNSKLDFNAFAESKLKTPALPLNNVNIQQISLF